MSFDTRDSDVSRPSHTGGAVPDAWRFRGIAAATVALLASPAWSSECDTILDRYNLAIQSTAFGNAIRLLTECADRCVEQRNLCALSSINLQSTARSLIGSKVSRAQSLVAVNPGYALRLYRQAIEYGAINPGANESAMRLAEQQVRELEPVVRQRIAELVAKGEQQLAANEYSLIRDTFYEINAVEYGSEAGRSLAERAAKKYEIHIVEEAAKSEAILDEIMQRARSSDAKVRKPSRTEVQKAMDRVASILDQGLELLPGQSRLVQLNNRTKKDERELRGKNRLDIQFKEADPVARETPQAVLAQAREQLAKGNASMVHDLTNRIVGSLDPHQKADAYVLRGLAYTVQINVNMKNSLEGRKQKSLAKREFNTALQMDPKVQMPKGYEQYAAILEESRDIG